MKHIYKFLILSLVLAGLSSCSGDYDSFLEEYKYEGTPSKVSNIVAESLPGAIKLKWDVPSDSNYYFVQIKYYDHRTEEEKAAIATAKTNELIIPNTLAKFGKYEFTFQSFNDRKIGSEIQRIEALSGKAPIQENIQATKIDLKAENLSTNAQEPSEGHIANLLDGNGNTFFHTQWSGGDTRPPLPHYMDIKLDEPLSAFRFYYLNRNGSEAAPEHVEIYVSNDGKEWTELTKIRGGLPSGSRGEYTSEILQSETPFTYLRWSVTQVYGMKGYWNMAEFSLYDIQIEIIDPEQD